MRESVTGVACPMCLNPVPKISINVRKVIVQITHNGLIYGIEVVWIEYRSIILKR